MREGALGRPFSPPPCIADEVAFWRSEESSNPDLEILHAVRPSMATTKGLLLCISSPYARRGALWSAYKDHYGQDGDVLVWQAASRDMNPEIEDATVTRALPDDPGAARAEWLGMFREDLEAFVSIEVLAALVSPGVHERSPLAGVAYVAFCDPAGGSGADSMTVAIAHSDAERKSCPRSPRRSPTAVFSGERRRAICRHPPAVRHPHLDRRPSLAVIGPPRRSSGPASATGPNGKSAIR